MIWVQYILMGCGVLFLLNLILIAIDNHKKSKTKTSIHPIPLGYYVWDTSGVWKIVEANKCYNGDMWIYECVGVMPHTSSDNKALIAGHMFHPNDKNILPVACWNPAETIKENL
jgi:hypothetical protein